MDCDVLMIAVGMKGQIESLLRFLHAQETKPGRIYILVQKNMIPVLEDLVNPQIILLPWPIKIRVFLIEKQTKKEL